MLFDDITIKIAKTIQEMLKLNEKEYLSEGNRNRVRRMRAASRVFRVDTRPGEKSFGRYAYRTSPEGSGPLRPGDTLNTGEKATPPVTFATPHAPNPLYAFSRRNRRGKIVPALSVQPSSGRGTIFTTRAGLEGLKRAKTNVVSASKKGFEPVGSVMSYDDPEEVVSTEDPKDIKTTPVKNPLGFVKSRFDIKTKSKRKLKSLFKKLASRNTDSSVTFSGD